MRQSLLLCIFGAAACLATGQLHAQQIASAQVGIVRPVGALVPHAVTLPPMVRARPRRWPYVVAGAVVGGVAGGVWVVHEVSKTDDAMFVPVVAVGAVAAGAAVGALGGLIVSVIVDPRYE